MPTRLRLAALLCVLLPACASPRAEQQAYLGEILRSRPFSCDRDARLVLCVVRGSEAERRRGALRAERERALDRIETFFGRRVPGTVRVLVFPSYDEAAPYPVGTASPELATAYVAFQRGTWAYERHNPGHELTHLFSNTDARGRTTYVVGLLDEGLAEYLGGFELDPHLRLTQHLQAAGASTTPVRIEGGSLHRKSPLLYSLGASFVKFLVEAQPGGRARVLRLLERTRLSGPDEVPSWPRFVQALEAVFEKPYPQLMEEWNDALVPYWTQDYPTRAEDRAQLDALLRPNRIRSIHYRSFPRFLRLVVSLDDGRRAVVEATPDDAWRVVDPDWRPAEAPARERRQGKAEARSR